MKASDPATPRQPALVQLVAKLRHDVGGMGIIRTNLVHESVRDVLHMLHEGIVSTQEMASAIDDVQARVDDLVREIKRHDLPGLGETAAVAHARNGAIEAIDKLERTITHTLNLCGSTNSLGDPLLPSP